jgi:translation elongation factor EF-G
MGKQLRNLHIEVPQSFTASLMVELSRIGALVQGMANTSSMQTIRTEVPSEEVRAFELWLASASKGQGRVVRNHPVDRKDA